MQPASRVSCKSLDIDEACSLQVSNARFRKLGGILVPVFLRLMIKQERMV